MRLASARVCLDFPPSPVFALPVYESLCSRELEIGILALADLLGGLRKRGSESGRARKRGVGAAAFAEHASASSEVI